MTRLTPSPPATPAQAYWNQRHVLREAHDRLVALEEAVDDPRDLTPNQWAQLLALALEFQPTLILELGRDFGNSTCLFTEAANRLPANSCRVVSLCRTRYWAERTVPRLREFVEPEWFRPLDAVVADILTWDYRTLVRDDDRVLMFWDAHGFEIAECVLGEILPLLLERPHVVVMHDLSDARYLPPEQDDYAGQRLWMGMSSLNSGARVRLGHLHSDVPQAVSIVDFCGRNRLTLESADHSFHSEIGQEPAREEELRTLLGERHFSLAGHWFWFSLNAGTGPFTFPAFNPPRSTARWVWNRARSMWARLLGRRRQIPGTGPSPGRPFRPGRAQLKSRLRRLGRSQEMLEMADTDNRAAASFLPGLPVVSGGDPAELRRRVESHPEWFHKIDFGDLITPGYDFDEHWSWVATRCQGRSSVFAGKTAFEHGPADGLWSCWLTKFGCRRIVAADVADRDQYRLVIETFGLPVEYHPALLSSETPRSVRSLFDVVVSLGVLYHVHDPLISLIMYQRYLRPGGALVLEGGTILDDRPTLFYSGEGLVYGKEGGNQFIPSKGFLLEALTKSLGFEVQSFDFRKEWDHPSLQLPVGRSLIFAVKTGLPTIHYYPMLLHQLSMDGPEFGPVEWFYGQKG